MAIPMADSDRNGADCFEGRVMLCKRLKFRARRVIGLFGPFFQKPHCPLLLQLSKKSGDRVVGGHVRCVRGPGARVLRAVAL